ncbi:MAG: hypothetical protein ACE5Z5_12815 [Candidatus Bathyarchaeia archaeon]
MRIGGFNIQSRRRREGTTINERGTHQQPGPLSEDFPLFRVFRP